MKTSGILALALIVIFIIGAIIVANFFFANVLQVNVSDLPPFLKFVTHLVGAFLLFLIVKKFAR